MASLEEKGNLADIYADLLILGGQVRNLKKHENPESLRRRIVELFEEADRKGKDAGMASDALLQARYAVAAFLDEMILSSSWQDKDYWSGRPLQYEFFKEHSAGVEFFNRLQAIRRTFPANADVLEIYYLCLLLGFEGQYKLHGVERLKALIEELSRQLQSRRDRMPSLSPHGKRPEELIEAVKQELPSWVAVVSSAALVFFFYIVLSWMIGSDAGDLAEEIDRMAADRPSRTVPEESR